MSIESNGVLIILVISTYFTGNGKCGNLEHSDNTVNSIKNIGSNFFLANKQFLTHEFAPKNIGDFFLANKQFFN